jgi:hypothetical protein
MPPIFVACQSCGTLFIVPTLFGDSPGINLQFENVGYGPCPTCGGHGRILDGLYEFAEDTLHTFTATTPHSAQQIQRLIRIVQRAQRGEATAQDVANTITREAPGLGAIAQRLLIPKNAGEFYALLALLFTILVLLSSHGETTMSAEDVEKVAHDIVERVIGTRPPMPVTPDAAPPTTKRPNPPPRKRPARARRTKKRH